MLDLSSGSETSPSKRREIVGAKLASILSQPGAFNYTDALCLKEPDRTSVLEHLDGVVVNNNIPQVNQSPVENWVGHPKTLLIHVSPGGAFSGYVRKKVRIPGSMVATEQKVLVDYGNAAFVEDPSPDRHARMILVKDGWPVVQASTNGTRQGTVVEWNWLKEEVKSATPVAGAQELHDEILTRPHVRKLLGMPPLSDGAAEAAPASEAPMTAKKPGGERRVGV